MVELAEGGRRTPDAALNRHATAGCARRGSARGTAGKRAAAGRGGWSPQRTDETSESDPKRLLSIQSDVSLEMTVPMEFVHEVTAYLENKPGRLAKICSALAQEKIDIRALSVMETDGPSVLRLITSELESTKNVLTSLGTEFRVSEVLAVQLENRTGALAKVLEKLAEEHINVEYAYASTAHAPGKALGIFHTSNPKRASQVLNEAASSVTGGWPLQRSTPLALSLNS